MLNTLEFINDLFNIKSPDIDDNTQITSKNHHIIFKIILVKHNFSEFYNKKSFKSTYKKKHRIFSNSTHDNGLYFIEEPFGGHMPPDFILMNIVNNVIITSLKIELKCGNRRIMWNDGYPKKDTEYLYSDHKFKKTIIIHGTELASPDIISNIKKNLKKIKELNQQTKNDFKTCDFNIYVRKNNSQKFDISKLFRNIDFINFKKIIKIKLDKFIYIPDIMNTQFKAISLFSGAGGDTKGMSWAGVNVVGFVEFNEDAITTHLNNFPDTKLIGRDICEIKDSTFEEYNGIDILFGGFPCQSFSHGGKKNADDPRGQLYKQFIRVTKIIKPKFILGENVQGILSRKNSEGGLFKDDIIQEFNDIGYDMCYKLLDCKKFGVPQLRKRVFFIGIRRNLNIDISDVAIPETNNKEATLRDICKFTLKNALKIEKQKFLDIIPDDKCIRPVTNTEEKVSGIVPTNLKKCYDEEKNHGLSFKTRNKGTYSGIEDIDSQAHTILCAYNRMPRLFIPMKFNEDIYLRPFTNKELQQIQGFPEDYSFHGNDISVIKQIGNAVPPIVVCEVVKYLLTLYKHYN